MIDRATLLVADLERVPAILREHAAAALPDLGWGSGGDRPGLSRRVVLTGLGSSRFAALSVAPILRDAGLEVVVEHASSSRPAPAAAGTLVVAISSSGGTPETIAAARRARSAGATVLAVTNRPESDLGRAATRTLDLAAGHEASGIASATYAATVSVLVRLAESLGADVDASRVLDSAAGAAEAVLAGRAGWLAAAADLLDGGAAVHVLTDAAALGTAEQAALLLREGPRLDADATDAGDWLHVGIYTALPGYRAILLAGTPYDGALVETLHGRGGRVLAIGEPVPDADLAVPLPDGALGDPLARALVEPLVTSILAAELWRRARAIDH
ncbi:MAG TPA: SIS domain-containing protein [Candidatus Sulfomarinibacteraceae bacterium]|nr:SIS domain-containing protein [Candidatus Sulfomarinibacteraceae bacterium]